MHFYAFHVLSLSFISVASGASNLLNFADGNVGNVLGSAFGVPGINATYDYVVVGGGTAGLTIATRLAENPALKIAVVEAGGFYEVDNGNLSVTPGYSSYFTGADPKNFQPLVDWGFATVPQAVRLSGEKIWDHEIADFLGPCRELPSEEYTMRVARH